MTFLIVGIISFLWAMFLNVRAQRLLADVSSKEGGKNAPSLKRIGLWRLTPGFFLKLFLNGKFDASSKARIWGYPLLELCGAAVGVVLWHVIATMPAPTPYHFVARVICYGIFASSLFVATRTDLEAMVIPQIAIVILIPLGLCAAGMGILPITFRMSVIGGMLGYGVLWSIGALFKQLLKKDGLGEGDMELLGAIGLFVGPLGIWAVTLCSSFLGTIAAGVYMAVSGKGRNARIPFGPFLAVSALAYIALRPWLDAFLLGL